MRRIFGLGLALAASAALTVVPAAGARGLPLPLPIVTTLVSTVTSAITPPPVATAPAPTAPTPTPATDNPVTTIVSAVTAPVTSVVAKVDPSCGATATVFSAWHDASDYYLARNGGFESGGAAWTLSGSAAVVAGNEPFDVAHDRGTHALQLGAGASASSSACYGLTYPAIRFLAAATSGRPVVHVRIVSYGPLGLLSTLDGGTFAPRATWQPSPKLSTLFSAVTAPLAASSMRIQISVTGGTVRIDDLYVDPFLTKS
jgi:hypothetical protein